MISGEGRATATSGTIDMPRLDSTPILSASIEGRCVPARGNGILPGQPAHHQRVNGAARMLEQNGCRAT